MPTPDWLPLTSWNMRKIGPLPERTSASSLFNPYCDRRLNFLFYRNPFCEQYLTQAAGTIILKGVTISKGSVIGAGSVVTKSTRPYSVNAGNPCKEIKMRFTEEEIHLHEEKIKRLGEINE